MLQEFFPLIISAALRARVRHFNELSNMRAAVLYGKEDLRVEEFPERKLEAGEVRVAIRAALTCGTDLKVYKRGYHARMIVPPAVFGHELAGEIVEIGPGVTQWNPGNRVVAANSAPCGVCFYCHSERPNLCDDLLFLNGAYAERIVVPRRIVEKNLLRLKNETSFRDAALTEPLACVVQGINETQLKKAQTLLILGAGPIGLMFAAIAHQIGCSVAVVGKGEKRLAMAKSLGASAIYSPSQIQAFIQQPETRPDFDVVIEAVGKPETWEQAVVLVRKGGVVNLFGGCPSGSKAQIDTSLMHYQSLRILASFHHTPATIRAALAFIEEGLITARDFANDSCALSQLPALFAQMTRENKAIKTFIDVAA